MEDDNPLSRQSSRIRKIAPKLSAALLDPNTRLQVAQARLDALENDGVALDTAEADEDEDAFAGDEDLGFSQKKAPKGSKRKTRQAKALERLGNTKKAPRTFLEMLHECRQI
ncbi:hypothetical protein O6H91_12G011000 [Diphasiastrum complanatum]|uniref:Uncharacterized protein n=1 Tax=Diphasiastrum complanatum TaxID=34168 RepID=A0ACC2BZ00_DIPCM|nr:hypothetical protein O6H91_12G011000 [Diphasiastrum complanatum]